MHSRHSLDAPDRLLYQYERMFAALTGSFTGEVARGDSFSTFTIGGGAFTLPMWLERHYPSANHTVVEIDPEVVRTARRFFAVPADTRVRTVVADARNYVDQAPATTRYDIVYCDAFNAYSVPAHLTTREFIDKVARLLTPGGILLSNVIDIFDSGRFLGAYLATVRSVFPATTVYLPAESGWSSRATFVIAATRGWIPPATLRDADGTVIATAVPRERLEELARRRPPILTDDHAPVENLMAPVFLKSVR